MELHIEKRCISAYVEKPNRRIGQNFRPLRG